MILHVRMLRECINLGTSIMNIFCKNFVCSFLLKWNKQVSFSLWPVFRDTMLDNPSCHVSNHQKQSSKLYFYLLAQEMVMKLTVINAHLLFNVKNCFLKFVSMSYTFGDDAILPDGDDTLQDTTKITSSFVTQFTDMCSILPS